MSPILGYLSHTVPALLSSQSSTEVFLHLQSCLKLNALKQSASRLLAGLQGKYYLTLNLGPASWDHYNCLIQIIHISYRLHQTTNTAFFGSLLLPSFDYYRIILTRLSFPSRSRGRLHTAPVGHCYQMSDTTALESGIKFVHTFPLTYLCAGFAYDSPRHTESCHNTDTTFIPSSFPRESLKHGDSD